MKTIIRSLGTLVLGMLLSTSVALAEDVKVKETTTTTTTTMGTVSQIGPDGIVVRTASSPAPISYESTTTTTYVDESGKPVAIETVKSGAPVTIHYDKDGNKLVATKVVVRKTTFR